MGILHENLDEQEEQSLKARLKERLKGFEERKQNLREQWAKSQENNSLLVECKIIGAKKLDNKDFGGKSDPFCRVTLGKQKFATQVDWDTLNPEWNELCTFTCAAHYDRTLHFEVHHQTNTCTIPLGRCTHSFTQAELDIPVEVWKRLENSALGELGFEVTVRKEKIPIIEPEKMATESLAKHSAPVFPRSAAYQAMDATNEEIPDDPWSVLGASSSILSPEELIRRNEKLSDVYGDWDMDGSGRIEFDEIQQILVSFRGCEEAKQLQLLKKWGILVKCRQIPSSGYERSQLLPFIVRLTNEYSAKEFDQFVDHILETMQVMLDITEAGRRTKACWRLFKTWDTNKNLTLDTNQLEQIISGTPYGKANRSLLVSLLDKIRIEHPECKGVDDVGIREFQEFMDKFLGEVSEMEMNYVLGQIRTAMREERLEDTHLVTKYLNVGKKLYGGDVPAEGTVTEDEKLTEKLMWQLVSEARHAFDSLTLEEIENTLNDRNVTEMHVTIATPICVIFGIRAHQHPQTSKLCFWEGLKEFIIDDPERFLHFLQNFDCARLPYEVVQKVMVFHFREVSDPHFLLLHSKFLSCLCVWCEASVRLCCLINDWEYPVPPLNDAELVNPTYAGQGKIEDRTPGFLRSYPADVIMGATLPPKKLAYRLPKWGIVKNWNGEKEEERTYGFKELSLGYKGPPPRERTGNRPRSTVPESGSLNRLTQLLIRRRFGE